MKPWPSPILERITAEGLSPECATQLGGMSGGHVWRVRGEAGSLIVKRSRSPNEGRFYRECADQLRSRGVPSPQAFQIVQNGDDTWLILEDIPRPLPITPADRWQPDRGVLEVLARLHDTTREWSAGWPSPNRPSWSSSLTTNALTFLSPSDARAIRPILEALQREAEVLEAHWCWISGDPNPLNWGYRDDGSLVLYDWELFGPGVPAVDLAITIPGLGTLEQYATVARTYLDVWHTVSTVSLPWSPDDLTRDIRTAKALSVVQLLAAATDGISSVDSTLIDWLGRTMPGWIASITNHDGQA